MRPSPHERAHPKPREALLAAFHAPNHTLVRCGVAEHLRASGCAFRNPHLPQSDAVTRRTANELRNAMLADFNDDSIPSALTLTPKGIALAQSLQQAPAQSEQAAA